MRGDTKTATGLLALLLVVLSLAAYLPALRAGFIWDDDQFVTENSDMISAQGLVHIWTAPHENPHYYPLLLSFFWVQYRLWGLNPLGYHLVNIILHALNGVLLFLILRRLKVRGAWLAGAIFALHPVHVESVAWITEMKNTLSGFFYLAALWAYTRHAGWGDGTGWRDGKTGTRFYVASVFLFTCALLSKTTAVSLLLAILLLAWWREKRVTRRVVLELLPMLAVGLGLGVLSLRVEQRFVSQPLGAIPFYERCAAAGRSIWFYAGKLFWPSDLSIVYPRWMILRDWSELLPLLGVGVALFALWLLRRRLGLGAFLCSLFFVCTLIPIPFMSIGYIQAHSFVADHFQYLPSLGLIVLFAALVFRWTGRVNSPWPAVVVCAVLPGVLATLTWVQSALYHGEELWRQVLAMNPRSTAARGNLGIVLMEKGRMEEAMEHFSEILRMAPADKKARDNLASIMAASGRLEEAIDYHNKVLEENPRDARAHNNVGIALALQKNYEEAVIHFTAALRMKPGMAKVHDNLGHALVELGRTEEAMTHLVEALRIDGQNYQAHNRLGMVLVARGDLEGATLHFAEAVRLQPDFIGGRINLGRALAGQEKALEAEAQYTAALELDPDNGLANNNLAWLLATAGVPSPADIKRSIQLAERACGATGYANPSYLDTLAVAYAAGGQFDEALDVSGKAIGLAQDQGQTELAEEIGRRRILFEAGKPFVRQRDR